MKLVHEGEHYPCNQCKYKATPLLTLKQHIKSIHEGIHYHCDKCDYEANLRIHVKSIHEGDCYPCDQCDYKATQTDNLHTHKLYHV